MRVSVIGSSHTRDIFNTKFVENYEEHFRLDSYYTMNSILSIMSKPIEYDYKKLVASKIKYSEMEHYYMEFEKPMLKTLESSQPDVLLLDFHADARYGARAHGGEYLTDKLYAIKHKDVIDWDDLGIIYSHENNTRDFIMMWRNSFDRFMAFMKNKLPNTVVIVNTMKGTNEVTDSEGNQYISEAVQDLDIDRINELWRVFDNYAIDKYNLKAIRFRRTYALDADYTYGLGNSIISFTKDYFEDCYKKLLKLVDGIQPMESVNSKVNLVIDSNFKHMETNWLYDIGAFEVVSSPNGNIIRTVPCEESNAMVKYQLWSKPIEIQGDGETEYTVSFNVKIPDVDKLKDAPYLFGIRTFKSMHLINLKASIDRVPLQLKDDIKSNEEYRYEYTFKPNGRFMRVAIWMTGAVPGVEFSRIKLERAKRASEYTK